MISPFSVILKPSDLIIVPSEINFEFSLLSADCFIWSKKTLSEKSSKFGDLKITLFSRKMIFSPIKLPFFAFTDIFSFSLLIVKLGLIISNLESSFSLNSFICLYGL